MTLLSDGPTDRRKNSRRQQDHPIPMWASRTVLSAWIGILASVAGLLWIWISYGDRADIVMESASIITLTSSFGAFVFRVMAKSQIG